jgi:hypothetical protein
VSLLRWPNINWPIYIAQVGLLFRAVKLTARVVRQALVEFSLTLREEELYAAHFEEHGLSKREFRELLDAGAEWSSWAPSEGSDARRPGWDKLAGALIIEGKPTQRLLLITKGKCAVICGGVEVAQLGPGNLVGENSFSHRMMGDAAPRRPAMASVLPRGPIEYVAWPSERLVKQLAKSSYAKACLLTIIAAAQAQKLEASSVSLSLSPSRQSSQDDVSNSNTRPIP